MSRVTSKIVMKRAWEFKRKQPRSSFSICLGKAWKEFYSFSHSQERQKAVDNVDTSGMTEFQAICAKLEVLGEMSRAQGYKTYL